MIASFCKYKGINIIGLENKSWIEFNNKYESIISKKKSMWILIINLHDD